MKIDFLDKLIGRKNLLAFSHGSDSTALFYALLNHCEFDLCLINYHTRDASNLEENAAKKLALKYGKKIYIRHAYLENSNFECKAREFRWAVFDELMCEYENLITAHNLNDNFEWFLMQFARGAGLCNLLGLSGCDSRKNYQIIRPLINISKREILNYLKQNNYKYFQDESNFDTKYKRNEMRINFANDFLFAYENGVRNSLKYLQIDKSNIYENEFYYKGIYFCKDFNAIDKAIKKLGFTSSAKQKSELKQELAKLKSAELFFGKASVCVCEYQGFFLVFLKCSCKLDKKLKEKYRLQKIPANLRFYLATNNINPSELFNVLS